MNKKTFLTVIAAAIAASALTALAVSAAVPGSCPEPSESRESLAADTHFTSSATAPSLPDLTGAAERGVEAVVFVETRQKVTPRSANQGIDPFEFFFGPSYGQQQREQREQPDPQSESNYRRSGSGSGVTISADGYIVTNNHVIDQADEVRVTLNSGDSFVAKVVGADPSTDIALLKIEAKTDLPYLTFGDSDNLRLGEWVIAVGNPFGLNSTVTAGIVSAKGRSLGVIGGNQMGIEAFIQTDAAVNPGNSGGALLSADGSLVGINTLIKSPTGTYAGYSFAVPSTIARKVVGDIRQWGVVQRAVLGITMQEITDQWIEKFGDQSGITAREGVYVYEVSPNGAAAAAGIKKGDVITEINGQKIAKPSALQEAIAGYRPGDKIKIMIKKGSSVKQIEVTLRNRSGKEELVSRNDVDMIGTLGAELRNVSEKAARELRIRGGVQVTEVKSNGILAKARVRAGYIITAINDQPITRIDDLNRITDTLTSIDGIYPDGRMASYSIVQ